MDHREAVNRTALEHVERLRKRLADGRHEIERQQASIRWLQDPSNDGVESEPTEQ